MKLFSRISPLSIYLCICVVYTAGFFAHAAYLKKTVYGDGIYYYSWLRSAVIDHSVNFPDGNKYSIGPAIVWAPLYMSVHTILRGNGYTLPYQYAAGITGLLITLFSLLILWRLLRKYYNTTVSIITIATLAGATNLLFYGSVDVVNSHAVSFFASVVFLTLLYQKQKNWIIIGMSLGFLGMIRTQDLLYGILCLPFITKNTGIKIALGSLIAFIPQFVAWQLVYGTFWISPYLTGGEGFAFLSPHIVSVLFNSKSGLFLWTPVTVIGAIGLIASRRYMMLIVFILEVYVVASWSTWWQGASYSGRMFVSSLPLLSFGIASVYSRLSRFKLNSQYFILAIVLPLSLINIFNIIYFLLHI